MQGSQPVLGQRILGIDPGSRVTGFGVIEFRDKQWHCVAAGSWALQGTSFIQRLHDLQKQLGELLIQLKPNVVAIEDIFVQKNARSALKLGQARGVAIASVLLHALPIYEYAPRQVKQAVVGKGAASKQQVQAMIQVLLKFKQTLTLDASDALAVALCHGHVQGSVLGMLNSTHSFTRKRTSKRSKQWLKHDWKNTRPVD